MVKMFVGAVLGCWLLLAGAHGSHTIADNTANASTIVGSLDARKVLIPTTPCKFEDSTNCFWDAGTQGNGHGHSFWTDRDGHVSYLDPRFGFAVAMRDSGWRFWGVYDGHHLCFAKVGDTMLIRCYDGYRTTS